MIEELLQNVSMGEDGIWYSSRSAGISYPEHSHGECFAIEDNSFWFAHRNMCIAELVRAFPPDRNSAIFDIGGGNGFVAKGLVEQGHDVVLIEPGIAGAQNAKRRGLANIVCATLESAQPVPGAMAAAGAVRRGRAYRGRSRIPPFGPHAPATGRQALCNGSRI